MESVDRFNLNARRFGAALAEQIADPTRTFDQRLNDTYYDAARVFFQLAEHFRGKSFYKDKSFYDAGLKALHVYGDLYIGSNAQIPGYWTFPDGLYESLPFRYESAKALEKLAEEGAYTRPTVPLEDTAHADLSREVAYAIRTLVIWERYTDEVEGGERLPQLVNQAHDHIRQWVGGSVYAQPFMVALTCEALIEIGRDHLEYIRAAADAIWKDSWDEASQSMLHREKRVDPTTGVDVYYFEPAPDLNLLIAPVYGWLWHHTGQEKYRDQFWMLFHGGVSVYDEHDNHVSGAYLGRPVPGQVSGKHFNQQYRWSLQGIKWAKSRVSDVQVVQQVKEEPVKPPVHLQLVKPTRLSPAGLAILKYKEALALKAYRDLGNAGKWTIGWGHTTTAKRGMVITKEQAEALLRDDLLRFESAYEDLVKVQLSTLAKDAVLIFMFNIGVGAFKKSTFLELLNQRNYQAAAKQLIRWVRAGGVPRKGLYRRRGIEEGLFIAGLVEGNLWEST